MSIAIYIDVGLQFTTQTICILEQQKWQVKAKRIKASNRCTKMNTEQWGSFRAF